MKIKFNKFERVAGLFVLVALVGAFVVIVGVAVNKGWFSSKIAYSTVVPSADGLHEGTLVQLAGLRAGEVDDVELISANEVRIKFRVFEKFHSKIRKDSNVKVIRPFIIGEKVLEISVGTESMPELAKGSEIPSEESFDVMELLSGRKMGPFLGSIEQLTTNLKILLEAFGDPKRTEALVKMFDRLDPLINNLNNMSLEVTRVTKTTMKQKNLEKIVVNLVSITDELDKVLPMINDEVPDLGKQIGQVVKNLNELTASFQKITPAISAVAPDLPHASLRAMEALNEAVVLLKAMQKSFFLRGNVREVREEEAVRAPASKKKK